MLRRTDETEQVHRRADPGDRQRGRAGRKVADLCRSHGITEQTFYRWRSKYGGMQVSDVRRLKDLEAENARLKRMYADLSLAYQGLQDVLAKKF